MKCTNRRFYGNRSAIPVIRALRLLPLLAAGLLCFGCGEEIAIENPYDIGSSATNMQPDENDQAADAPEDASDIRFFAEDLCVAPEEQTKSDEVSDEVVEAIGVFLPASGTITYQKNIYEKLYPASTTKIMTAYLALTKAAPDDIVTVSAHAVDQASDSSVCGLREGDQIKMSDLLYGLMLKSGNDAAVAVAEHVSGSEQAFVELMNETARSFGATNTHFANPHGLHDENHYTCAYDLYLIFSHAIGLEDFLQLIQTTSYTAYYTNAAGAQSSQAWTNTNRYLSGDVAQPEGLTVIGGKTGTTNAAGNCLVLLSNNAKKEPVISVILKSDTRDNLYYVMNQVLSAYVR